MDFLTRDPNPTPTTSNTFTLSQSEPDINTTSKTTSSTQNQHLPLQQRSLSNEDLLNENRRLQIQIHTLVDVIIQLD